MDVALKRSARRLIAGASAGLLVALGVGVGLALDPGSFGLAHAEPPKGGYPPDPPSTPSTTQWLFDVKVDKGKVSIERARAVKSKNAEATARVMGRFALELWIGNELLDRIRFNVPIGADLPREDDGRPFRRPSFDKVTTKFAVKMADQPRAVFVKLVDRATGEETKFAWPPQGDALVPFGATDAGKPDGGSPDAGAAPDGGKPDGGSPDAGPPPKPDGGSPDAGPPPKPDGGSPDAGR